MTPDLAPAPIEVLRSSAKGWHGAQLAVLGFIGLCGVLVGDAGAGNPRWLEVLAGLLVLAALVLACAATALVASVAWPVYAEPLSGSGALDATAHDAAMSPGEGVRHVRLRRAGRRLRGGIALTYVAVVVLALAATSAWWPHPKDGALAEVRTDAGTFCGQLVPGGSDGVSLVVAGQRVDIDVARLRGLSPVDSCR